jgi:hypothetical protein
MTRVGVDKLTKAVWLFAIVVLVTALPAWGSTTACPTNPTTSTLTPYLGPGNGCFTVDATFSDFSVGPATTGSVINGNTILAENVNLCAPGFSCPPTSDQIFLTDSATNPGTITLGSPGPDTQPQNADTNFCSTANIGSGGWCLSNSAKQSQYETSQIYLTLTADTPTNTIGLDVTAISHSSSGGGTGGEALVLAEICPGSATVTSFSQTCAGYQVIQAGSIAGNFNKVPVSVSAIFSSPDTVYYIRDTIILQTTQSNGDFSTISGFDILFLPEPSTISLMGFGLAGLGLMHRRMRRKRAQTEA